MVQTNSKLGCNSESKKERDYILGGPYKPFVRLSIAHYPHFEILPGNNEILPGNKSAWLEFPVPCYIHTRCILVQTNIKLAYNSESKK